MAGYSRQSVADIIAGEVVKAAPLNAEYNALRDAFAFATGHKHDGSSTEGAYIPLIADTDALNKVVIDTSNNRVGVFVEVSSAAVEQVRFQDGAIVPVTDNDIDLGTSSLEFKNLYIDGTANIDSLVADTADINAGTIDNTAIGGTTAAAGAFTTLSASGAATLSSTLAVTGNTTVGGTLGVTGATTLSSTAAITGNTTIGGTLAVTGASTLTGNTSVGGTLGVTGATTLSSTLGVTGNATLGGTLGVSGATTLSSTLGVTGNATLGGTAEVSSNATVGGTLAVTGATTLSSTLAVTGAITASGGVTGNLTGNVTSTGTSTFTTVDINGGAIDGTAIGASSASTGAFTTVTTSGQATLATADINGGTADNVVIGGTTPAAGTFTTVTANTGITGTVTGNVTGNLTGNVTGNVTGNLTGNVTGNVTASSGSSTFNNVTVNGTLDVTGTTIANVTDPVLAQDAATKNYVDTSVANLVDAAPAALDTLNELAAAIGDDANFSTTITNSIATKLPLAGGTMSGAIAMGTNKITGMGDPTANQDAATKAYVDTGDAAQLSLSGGTMTGAIDMGANKITTTYTPTNAADLTTKTYVDGILGSATAAAASAAAAATSETNAATSATNAATSETNAATSATNAAASYDSFDDRYLGAKASAPTLDNDGDALIVGALYFDTTDSTMKVYSASGWIAAGSAVNGTANRYEYVVGTASGSYGGVSLNTFPATYDAGFVDVYLNGVRLINGTDFTATTGTSIVLSSDAVSSDLISIIGYGTFELANFSIGDATDVDLSGGVTDGQILVYNSTAGDFLPAANLSEVVGDTTPQLGGNLDLNSNDITGTGNIDVTGTVTADGILTQDGTSGATASTNADQLVIDSSTRGGLSILTPNNQLGEIYFGDPDNNNIGRIFYDHSNDSMSFRTNAAVRAVIDSSGNVGIGTSSPARTLHLAGTNPVIRFEDTTSGNAVANIDANFDSEGSLLIDVDPGNAGASSHLEVKIDGTERMRIDSSGNLLVGKTAIGQGTAGFEARASGQTFCTDDGNTPFLVNRLTSDGELIQLNKDGTNVGSIGSRNTGTSYITLSTTSNTGLTGSGAAVCPSQNGALADNAVDFGFNTARFKDLYLSGSVKATTGTGNVGLSVTSTDAYAGIELADNTTTGVSFFGVTGSNYVFQHNGSEKMRLDSSGNLLVGHTGTNIYADSTGQGISLNQNGRLDVKRDDIQAIFNRTSWTSGSAPVVQFRANGAAVGEISVTSSGTTYNTTSDARLKTDIQPIADATDRLMQMNPVSHKWIADPEADAVVGFIAQEMQEIVPEAVSGTPDGEEMMAMDYGRITPVLVAALQDAHRKIEELESRLAAVEAK